MKIQIGSNGGGHATVVVTGDVDAHTNAEFDSRLTELVEGGHDTVVLDCSGVEFLDSSGLGALIKTQKALQDRDGTLVLLEPSPAVVRLLDITGLTDSFQVSNL